MTGEVYRRLGSDALLALSAVRVSRSAKEYAVLRKKVLRLRAELDVVDSFIQASKIIQGAQDVLQEYGFKPIPADPVDELEVKKKNISESVRVLEDKIQSVTRELGEWELLFNTLSALRARAYENVQRDILASIVSNWDYAHNQGRRSPERVFTDLLLASLGIVRVRDRILHVVGYDAFKAFFTPERIEDIRRSLYMRGK